MNSIFQRRSVRTYLEKPVEPEKIETALRKILPPEESNDFCHRLVLHGRAVCPAKKPVCENCCVRHVCQFYAGQN